MPSPPSSIPPQGKNFPIMEQNLMDWAKKLWVWGSNPPHGKKFSTSGAKFHGWGMGVWGMGLGFFAIATFATSNPHFFG